MANPVCARTEMPPPRKRMVNGQPAEVPHSGSMSIPQMKLSFVIPVYRTEIYLARCLDSLVAQSDGSFEAIVVDDCSPGPEMHPPSASAQAREIVARYDQRFRYLRQDRNRSTFQAKATGARQATGNYILPLDSDDYVRPRLVEEIKKAVATESLTPPDVVVYQMAKVLNGRVRPEKYNHPPAHCSGEEALDKLFAGRIFMPVCGKAIRREVFLKAYEDLGVGPDFYLNFTDDLCWLVPILLHAKRVSFIAYDGYRYWRHDDSMTKDELTTDQVNRLAEQSRRSVDTVVASARRLGVGESTCLRIRALIYPTIRWLLRDRRKDRAVLENAFGPELVAATLRWDAAAGGRLAKLIRHFRLFGCAATLREIAEQIRHR